MRLESGTHVYLIRKQTFALRVTEKPMLLPKGKMKKHEEIKIKEKCLLPHRNCLI